MILNETPSKRRIIKLKHRRGATVTTKIIIYKSRFVSKFKYISRNKRKGVVAAE